eukprot:gb/GECH01010962.1/.p1 GENE.gb/GECH01010962.1/~~gb/GECH01010962.1/.p1  ORF type:complete len:256 (+),score=52.20 gb/GECH01010962.1/:1-768(+)
MDPDQTIFLTPAGASVQHQNGIALSTQMPYYNIIMSVPRDLAIPHLPEHSVYLYIQNHFRGIIQSLTTETEITTISCDPEKRKIILHRVSFREPFFSAESFQDDDPRETLHLALVHNRTKSVALVSSGFRLYDLSQNYTRLIPRQRNRSSSSSFSKFSENRNSIHFFQEDKNQMRNISPQPHPLAGYVDQWFHHKLRSNRYLAKRFEKVKLRNNKLNLNRRRKKSTPKQILDTISKNRNQESTSDKLFESLLTEI